MPANWRDITTLRAELDQDMAKALDWWAKTPEADKIRLWLAIQQTYPNPVMECITCMAQIGMTQVLIAALERETTKG